MTARVQFDADAGGATLRVEIYNEFDGQRSEMSFSQFPVRLGRNRRNDLVLLHEYVSQWHAVIGFVNGQLSIVQVGSSNSARVNGGKLVPNEVQPLHGGEEIRVVPFQLTASLSGQPAMSPPVDASQHRVDAPFPPNPQQPVQVPGPYPSGPLPGPEPTAPMPMQDPNGHRGQGSQYTAQGPTGPQMPAAPSGALYMDGTPSGGEAFAVLNRLAQRYWGRPLQNAQEAAYLGGRLEHVLDRLLDGVLSMRNGQLLFLQEMGIKHREENLMDHLETPPQLGGALLAGQDPRVDPALEDTFERLKLHQLALLRGVEAGVKALMRKLGPRAVEKQARTGNARQLWDYFCQLHGDLEEGQERFKLLYGAQFKKAYSRIVYGKKKTG